MSELTRRDKQVVGGMVALLVAGGGALVAGGENAGRGASPAPARGQTVVAGAESEMGAAFRPPAGRPAASPRDDAPADGPAPQIRTLNPWQAVTTPAAGVRTTLPGITPPRTTTGAPPAVQAPVVQPPVVQPPVVLPPLPTPTTPSRPVTGKPKPSKPKPRPSKPVTSPPVTTPPTTTPPATTPPVTTPPVTVPPATEPPATTPPAEPTAPPATQDPAPAEPQPAKSETQDHDFPWEPGAGGLPDDGAWAWPPAVPTGNPLE